MATRGNGDVPPPMQSVEAAVTFTHVVQNVVISAIVTRCDDPLPSDEQLGQPLLL